MNTLSKCYVINCSKYEKINNKTLSEVNNQGNQLEMCRILIGHAWDVCIY